MQELKLADDLFADLKSGRKKNTIRCGHRAIRWNEPLVFESTDGTQEPVEVYVTDAMWTTVEKITDEIAQWGGATSAAEVVESLKSFYGAVEPTTPVTVVSFVLMEEQRRVEAAARVLDKEGRICGWFKGPAYDDLDPISKNEFEAIVERVIRAAGFIA